VRSAGGRPLIAQCWQTLCGFAVMAALLAVAAAAGPGAARGQVRPAIAGPVVRIFPQVRVGQGQPAIAPSGGYTPAQIRAAYFLRPLLNAGINGKGQSIVIVDSFGSPTIAHDLAVFDKQFRLPAPPALKIIHPAGPIPKYKPTNSRFNWAAETTLDVEWAHAMAPDARIVLVETPVSENEGTSGFPQIVSSEKYVLAHHLGGVISQSFGATEQTFPKGSLRPLRGAYTEAAQPAHNVTVVSASGDAGATDYTTNLSTYYTTPVTSWPASDPLVTSVGGLDLRLDRLGKRTSPDRVWNDGGPGPSAGGGGKSVIFGRPAYQDGVAAVTGPHRGVPDISMTASCNHPVDIFESFDGPGGWSTICGTSEATPIFAGVIALADQLAGHPLGPINAFLYQMAAAKDRGIVDITRGNNTVTVDQGGGPVTVKGFAAVKGYDLASGLGTVNADLFVHELVKLAASHATEVAFLRRP
jgi:subtilase family serine protease